MEQTPAKSEGRFWFWAAATYKAVHPGARRRRHLWERVVFLVQASSAGEARERATAVARLKEHAYVSALGQEVQWRLQNVEEVKELFDSEIKEGTEIYWQFFERVDRRPGE